MANQANAEETKSNVIIEVEENTKEITIEIWSCPEDVSKIVGNDECHCTLEELNTAGITDIQCMTIQEFKDLEDKVSTVLYLLT